jgi:2-polyprenyl-6-methoxyphenol hydroxylase-like FAD-dependent oxidoreductase
MSGDSSQSNRALDVDVLIAGAGPTGLTLACELARRGITCRIVDRANEYFAGSRGKGLQPRTLEVLDDLGVIDTVLAEAAEYPVIRSYDGEKLVWEHSMHEHHDPTPDVPYPNVLMIPQSRTEEILRDRLTAYGVHVELGTELITFEQDSGSVTATLARAGAAERVRAAYLVGADGGHSVVRKTLGIGFEGETYETQRALIGDIGVDGLDRAHWHTWIDSETRTLKVGLCPLPGTDVFQFTAPVMTDAMPELSLATLQQIVDEASGRSDIRLHDLSWISLYRVNIRMVDQYRSGRVFLAGDAAHVHSPAGGQGLNTGIQDAYNLGWKLGHVLMGAPAQLLESYQEERLPIAADVLGISTWLLNQSARGDAKAYQRGAETRQLGLGYRVSSLSRDERGAPHAVGAGDRAPDAPCHTAAGLSIRLFDIFRSPSFTLLAFGAGMTDIVSAINECYNDSVQAYVVARSATVAGDATIVDTDGHAQRAYGIESDTLVLIRPDGYIGMITNQRSTGALEKYLSQVVAAQPYKS